MLRLGEDFRAFWAVVPATVLYDDSIPANAKLLYGQISTLTGYTGTDGRCDATNAQLAAPNKLSEDSVSRLIKALEKAGHIEVRYAPDPKDGHPVRSIYQVLQSPHSAAPYFVLLSFISVFCYFTLFTSLRAASHPHYRPEGS